MERLLTGLLGVAATLCPVCEPAQEPFLSSLSAQTVETQVTLHPKPLAPRRVSVADINARVVPIALEGSALNPPDDPKVLGWWGAKINAREGRTLLVGHTVSTGGGALDDLEKVPVGTRLAVSGVNFEIAHNRVVSKSDVARQAPRLFRQSGPNRVVIVTCEGFDPKTKTYDSNVVTVARRK